MAYATVEDVEARLGSTLLASEADALEVFLEDFSIVLDQKLLEAGKTAGDYAPSILKLIVSWRGVNRYLQSELTPGLGSQSQSMDNMSTSFSLSSDFSRLDATSFELTAQEKRLLGISSSDSFLSIPLEFDCS